MIRMYRTELEVIAPEGVHLRPALNIYEQLRLIRHRSEITLSLTYEGRLRETPMDFVGIECGERIIVECTGPKREIRTAIGEILTRASVLEERTIPQK